VEETVTIRLPQEFQNRAVELGRPLHIHHVACPANTNHLGAGDARRKGIDNPTNDRAIAIADQ